MNETLNLWPMARLREIAEIGTGIALGRELGPVYSKEYPYLRVANVQDGYIDIGDIKTVRILPFEFVRYQLQVGDILLTEGGDFDKLGRGAVWDGSIPDCLHQNHIFRVRLQNEFNPNFFAAYMASTVGRAYFLSCAKQTTNLASINKSQLSAMPVPIPLRGEQQLIARVIDEFDSQVKSLARLIEKQKYVLNSLAAQVILDSMSSPQVAIGDIIRSAPGGFIQTGPFGSQLHADEYTASGVPVVMPQDIIDYSISDNKIARISTQKARLLCRHQMNCDDVIFGRRGDLSRCAVVTKEQEGWLCGTGCLLARLPNRSVRPEWLALMYRHDHCQRQVLAAAVGSTMANLNTDIISRIQIHVPRIEEQERKLSLLDAQKNVIAKSVSELDKLKLVKQGLIDDLLTGRVRVPTG